MAMVKENENPVFDFRTLRMTIGALAFGLPWIVLVLVGRITTSISASYHEPPTRNIFVGALFVIGALLIAYKGHLQGEPPAAGVSWGQWFWSFQWLNRYQEDLISSIGGMAAISVALFPTACDKCDMDRNAYIHMASAFLLFANVVYFCAIAFLRSLNHKLLDYDVFKENVTFMQTVQATRRAKTRRTLNPLLSFWNFLTIEGHIFLLLLFEKLAQYQHAKTKLPFVRLWSVYEKKFARGLVYVIFGSLTLLVLLSYVILGVLVALKVIPDILTHTEATFVVETLSLWFFGVAWMTASQLQYGRQIKGFLERFQHKQPAAPEPGVP